MINFKKKKIFKKNKKCKEKKEFSNLFYLKILINKNTRYLM